MLFRSTHWNLTPEEVAVVFSFVQLAPSLGGVAAKDVEIPARSKPDKMMARVFLIYLIYSSCLLGFIKKVIVNETFLMRYREF